MRSTMDIITGGMHNLYDRTVHIYTGMDGMEMISQAIAIHNAADYIEWALENGKIKKDQGTNLLNMLRSPDKDNANMALMAIEQLIK
mgnify:CR=1 FL=1